MLYPYGNSGRQRVTLNAHCHAWSDVQRCRSARRGAVFAPPAAGMLLLQQLGVSATAKTNSQRALPHTRPVMYPPQPARLSDLVKPHTANCQTATRAGGSERETTGSCDDWEGGGLTTEQVVDQWLTRLSCSVHVFSVHNILSQYCTVSIPLAVLALNNFQ